MGGESNPNYHRLHVRAVMDETADCKSLVFDVPPELAAAFAYKPGQFLTLRLPVNGRHVRRCYSMSSAPATDDAPRVTIKRVVQGLGSNWICDHIKAGDSIEVLPPSGMFTPRAGLDDNFLLLAGGSGITPVFSILRAALHQGNGRIVLLYMNRDESSVIFRKELMALAATYPTRLQIIHWLDSVQGVPSLAQLAELARPFADGHAFICGPGPFMDASVEALRAIEMPSEHIHVERFMSLPDEEDTAQFNAAADTDAAVSVIAEAQVELLLDGEVHQLACSGGQTILDAALAAGIAAPHSCQAGMCASCMCRVVEGSVHLRHNEVLDKKDLAKAWTLACQALPTSTRVRVEFP